MNWVGGARKRVKLQGEKKLQKEFFERRKLENKPYKKKGSNIQKPSSVSQDLLALQTVSNIHYRTKDVPKSIRKLDLDQFKSIVSGRRYNEVELPSSPNEKPSMIHLFEKGYSSSDDMSSSLKRCKYGHEPDVRNSFKTKITPVNNLPSRHVVYEEKESHKHKRVPVCIDSFEKSFQPVPLALSSRKSCLKPTKSMSYEELQKNTPRKVHSEVAQNSKKSTYIAFDPWASEDFQATPLIKYETEKCQGSGFDKNNRGDFMSLQDRGYITDQERFHGGIDNKFYDRKLSQSFDLQGWKQTQPFEVSFDHDDSKNRPKRLSQSFSDIYDGHIENRFRTSAPMFSKMNRGKVSESQGGCGTKFAEIPRNQPLITEKLRSRITIPEPQRRSSISLKDTVSVTYLDRGMSKMNFTPSDKSDKPMSELHSCKQLSRDRHYLQDLHLGNETIYQNSNTTHVPSNFGNNIPRKSPKIGSPFPHETFSGPEKDESLKYRHRESSTVIKSVSSTTSSCSETRSCINHDRLSDFESELQDSMNLHEDSVILNNKEEEQMKNSSIDEILNEMKQLENESVNDVLSEQNQDDENKKNMTLLLEEPEPGTDDEMEEVNEVLQKLVHKVVLTTFQHNATESAAFVIPSRSITVTPWKSATKLLKFSQDSSKSSQVTYQSSQNSFRSSQDAIKNSIDIAARDTNQISYCKSKGSQVIKDKMSQNMNVTSTTSADITDSFDASSVKQTNLREAVSDGAYTPSWNNLNLVSPITGVSLHQSNKRTTSMQLTRELFPEEVLTPMMKPKFAMDFSDQFTTPCTAKPMNKLRQDQELTAVCGQSDEKTKSKTRSSSDSDMIHASAGQTKKRKFPEQENHSSEMRSNYASPAIMVRFCCNHKATQTERARHDVSTSPIQFESFKTMVDIGTQYDLPNIDGCVSEVLKNTEDSVFEVAMEQGDSQELMDCSVQVEVIPIDKQWTISDSMLEPLSQSDSVGYSLRSRTKST